MTIRVWVWKGLGTPGTGTLESRGSCARALPRVRSLAHHCGWLPSDWLGRWWPWPGSECSPRSRVLECSLSEPRQTR